MKTISITLIICLLTFSVFGKSTKLYNTNLSDSNNKNQASHVVSFQSFDAILIGKTVTCKWITNQEVNHNHFELEASFDGENFKTLVLVFGANGNMNDGQRYQFKDKSLALKRNDFVYYRLKLIGINGNENYSKVIKLALTENAMSELGAVPNPFLENITYSVKAPNNGYVITKIINLGGRLMAMKHIAVNKGDNKLSLDQLNGFSTGMYIMVVTMNGNVIGRQKINKV